MFGLTVLDLLMIFIYFLIIILIGLWSSWKIKNEEDYFLGGRTFGKFIQTFAAFGMATSAESAVGMSVLVARNGIAGIWQNLLSVFGMPIYWITSIWYRRLRVLTLGDFFAVRYNSKVMPSFYALLSAVFFMIVIGLGLTAITKTVTSIASKPYEQLTEIEKQEYHKAIELEQLENTDAALLTEIQKSRLSELRLENPRKEFSFINETALTWFIAIMVLAYTLMGGLLAAFISDTIQGIFILILSLLLFPFAIIKINTLYGGSGLGGIIEVAKSKLPEASFEIWGSPALVDFTWYYMLFILIMSQITVAVQANQLLACGSAKDEYTARYGFTSGILLKRGATLLWGVSAFLLVILYGSMIKNPDYLWGYACRDLLGQLNVGLIGLMIACLMAATMSTASALMLTTSSLLTYNFFKPVFPNFDEKVYIKVGKWFGFITIIGGVLLSTLFTNVFEIMKLLWEFNIVIAPAFWLGMKWRRANKIGAWTSIIFSTLFFIVLQTLLPLFPGIKTDESLLKKVQPITVVRTYTARDVDVEERKKEIENWKKLNEIGKAITAMPKELKKGEKFEKKYITPERSIFWTQGIRLNEQGKQEGIGMLSLELVILNKFFDLSQNPHALNETIRIIIRTFFPFVILMVVSLLTKPDDKKKLDVFYAILKTPAIADREEDAKQVQLSIENPSRFDYKKLFKNSNWEFEKLDKTDLKGIILFTIYGIIIMAIVYWISTLGK